MVRYFLATLFVLVAGSTVWAYGIRTGQASITTVTPVLVGTASDRVSLTIFNQDGTNPVYCGATSLVTSSTGLKIPAGIGFTIDTVSQGGPEARSTVYCVATGGSVTVSFLEGVS